MATRRELLLALGALPLLAPDARAAAPARGARRGRYAIDALSGSLLFHLPPGDPGVAQALQTLRASGMTLLVASPAPQGLYWLNDAAFEKNKADLSAWKATVERHPDVLAFVGSAADLQRARREGKVGVAFNFQGTESLGEDVDRIAVLRALGLRVMQLTHNRRNLVGDGCMEPGNAGLSNFGHKVIERLNAERVLVDLSHGSQRTMAEGIRASKAPVLIGHTGCRALSDLPRNTGDAELRALAERGGVAGIIFWPYLRTDTQPMAADVIAHIEHAIDVCGEDHVGIGTDGAVDAIERTPAFERENLEWVRGAKQDGVFDAGRPNALYTFIPDLNVPNRFEVLAGLLSRRGHSGARIDKVLGGNFARVMGEVWG